MIGARIHKSPMRVGWVLLLGLFLMGAQSASAQVALVVNKANPVRDISLQKVQDIYLGNTVSWSDNLRIFPVSLKSKENVTQAFFKKALQKKPNDMKRIWIRLMLSGEVSPPKVMGLASDVLDYVASNEGAIGFVDLAHIDGHMHEQVQVIAIEGSLPSQAGYLLGVE